MFLINIDGYYVHALHGVYYITWTREKEHALHFPNENIEKWRKIVQDIAGMALIFQDDSRDMSPKKE